MKNQFVVRIFQSKGFFLNCFAYLCFISSILSLPLQARAEDIPKNNILYIRGLSLPCPGCSVYDETYCRIVTEEGTKLLPCDQVPDYILVRNQPLKEQLPTANELLNFLLRDAVRSDTARSALELILKRTGGEETLRGSIEKLAIKYPAEAQEIIESGIGSRELWLDVWKSSFQSDDEKIYRLRTLIAARLEELTLTDFFSELMIVDAKKDLQVLAISIETLESMKATHPQKHDWPVLLRLVVKHISSCSGAKNKEDLITLCGKTLLASLPRAVKPYLERLQMKEVVRISTIADNSLDVLTLFFQTNYQQFRTPNAHLLLRRSIERLKVTSHQEAEQILPFLQMIEFFSENDRDLAQSASFLLADIITVEERNETSLAPVRLSYEKINSFLPKETPRANGRVILSLLLVGAIGLTLYLLWRKKRMYLYREVILSADERAELRELFSFFSLPVWSSSLSLTREYRRRAKKLHPDTGASDANQFTILSEKYHRAKALLSKSQLTVEG